MRKAVLFVALFAFAASGWAATTWKNAPLVDSSCAAKAKAHPDAHSVSCTLQCSAKGVGILAADGTFLRLDAQGAQKAIDLLKQTNKKAGMRVDIVGDRKGDTIQVQSIKAS